MLNGLFLSHMFAGLKWFVWSSKRRERYAQLCFLRLLRQWLPCFWIVI